MIKNLTDYVWVDRFVGNETRTYCFRCDQFGFIYLDKYLCVTRIDHIKSTIDRYDQQGRFGNLKLEDIPLDKSIIRDAVNEFKGRIRYDL